MACDKECGFVDNDLGNGNAATNCRTVMEEMCGDVAKQECETVDEKICDPIQEEICDDGDDYGALQNQTR